MTWFTLTWFNCFNWFNLNKVLTVVTHDIVIWLCAQCLLCSQRQGKVNQLRVVTNEDIIILKARFLSGFFAYFCMPLPRTMFTMFVVFTDFTFSRCAHCFRSACRVCSVRLVRRIRNVRYVVTSLDCSPLPQIDISICLRKDTVQLCPKQVYWSLLSFTCVLYCLVPKFAESTVDSLGECRRLQTSNNIARRSDLNGTYKHGFKAIPNRTRAFPVSIRTMDAFSIGGYLLMIRPIANGNQLIMNMPTIEKQR